MHVIHMHTHVHVVVCGGCIGDVYGCGLSYPINLYNEFTTIYTFMGVSLTIMGGLITEVMNNVSQLILMND